MATRTIKTKIGLEGDQEYKKAISEINSGLGVLNSEMKKVSAAYQDNAKSVEALTEKGDVLNRKLLTQKDKVEELKKALEYSKKEYGEASSKTMEWEKKLNDAEAAVYNTEAAIKENNEELEKATNKSDLMGMSIKDLADKFGIHLPEGVSTALDAFEGFSAGSVTQIGLVIAAVKTAIDAVKKLIDVTQEAAAHADDIATEATKSGLDTYTLQVLNYMEDLADVDVSTVESSVKKLTSAMSSAKDGTGDAAEAFQTLGVNILNSDGTLRNATDVLWDCVDALGEMEAGTERDAASMEIFGKNATELNTLINVGSDGFREYAEEAENVGYILSEKDLKALNDYNDSLDESKKIMEAVTQEMAVKMAPGLEELNDGWTNLKKEGLQLIIDSGIIDFLSDLCSALGEVIGFVGDMLETLNMLLHPIETLKELLGVTTESTNESAAAFSANAEMATAAASANQGFNSSIQSTAGIANATTSAVKSATSAMEQYVQYASTHGMITDISEKRLAELGDYSEANEYRGSGYFGGYANVTPDEFKQILKDEGITSADQIYTLGEGAWNYYKASQWYGATSSYFNAPGDQNFTGGMTWVGENGPELVSLPSGSSIYNNQDSRDIAGGDNFYFTVNAASVKELNDLVKIAQNSRMSVRMRG